jgi:antitoxin MazE
MREQGLVMSTVIKTRLVKIGNSHGVRIPKLVLEQLNLSSDVELEVQDDHLIVRPVARPRADWAEQFRHMAERGDDQLLDPDVTLTEWEATEWQW